MATFKGNIEFRGADRTQGFRPIEIPDVTQQIRLNAQQYEATLQRNEKAQAAIEAFSVKMKRDRELDESNNKLEQLAGWSNLIKKGLDMGKQAYEQAKQTEAKMAMLDVQDSVEDLERTRQELYSLRQDSDQIEAVKAKVLAKENINYEAVNALNNLDNYQKFHLEANFGNTIGKTVKPYLQSGLLNDNQTEIELPDGRVITPSQAKSPAERNAAMDALLRRWHEETGASAIPDDNYRLTIKPQVNKARAEIMTKARSEWELVLSAGEQEKASHSFLSNLDLGKYVEKIASTKDGKGYLGKGRGWKFVTTQLKYWASNGQLSQQQVFAIFDKFSTRNPKVKWSDPTERQGLMNELLKSIGSHEKAVMEMRTQKLDLRHTEMEGITRQVAAQRQADGNPLTERELEDMNDQIIAETGKPSTAVKNIQNGHSADDMVQDDQRKQLEALARTNQLHSNHAAYLNAHPDVQNQFRNSALQGDERLKIPGNLKATLDLAGPWVKNHFSLTPFKSGHPQHDQLEARMKELTLFFYNRLEHLDNEPERAQLAWTKAQEEHRLQSTIEGHQYFKDASGNYPNIDGNPVVLKDKEEAARVALAEINQTVLTKGKSALPDAMDDAANLEKIAKDLPTNGYSLPYKYHHFGAIFGISPAELYNRARDAKQMGRIEFPKAVTDLDRGLTPAQLRAIYKSPTPQGRAGAYCTATGAAQWQRPPLPDNIGEHLEVSAQKHAAGTGLTWQELAMLTFAVGDAENRGVWRNTGVSGAGARGYWQFIKSTADSMGVDPLNSQSATDGAIRHIASSMKVMASNFPDLSKEELMGLAALAYNAGDTAVINNRLRNPQYGGSFSGGENRDYLAHVLMAMCRFGGSDIALHHPAMLNMSAFGDADIESFRSQYLTKR